MLSGTSGLDCSGLCTLPSAEPTVTMGQGLCLWHTSEGHALCEPLCDPWHPAMLPSMPSADDGGTALCPTPRAQLEAQGLCSPLTQRGSQQHTCAPGSCRS